MNHVKQLIESAPMFSEDEAAFMVEIQDRVLQVGRARYRPWQADSDERDVPRERDEEIFDAVIYAAMLVVKRKRERAERLRCFKADEAYSGLALGADPGEPDMDMVPTTVRSSFTVNTETGDVHEILLAEGRVL